MQVNNTILAIWLLRKCTSLQSLFVLLIHQSKLHADHITSLRLFMSNQTAVAVHVWHCFKLHTCISRFTECATKVEYHLLIGHTPQSYYVTLSCWNVLLHYQWGASLKSLWGMFRVKRRIQKCLKFNVLMNAEHSK